MADEPSVRWTCEACGCHTNTESDDPVSCGVCGTRRVSSLLLRRGILASSSGFENHHQEDEDDVEDEDHDEEDDDDEDNSEDEDDEDDDDHDHDEEEDEDRRRRSNENDVTNSLGSSPSSRARRRRNGRGGGGGGGNAPTSASSGPSPASASSVAPMLLRPNSSSSSSSGGGSRRSSSGGGSSRGGGPSSPADPASPGPDEILAAAQANAASYDPRWSDSHHGSSIRIDSASTSGRIAFLTEGGEEGRSVRALEPLPTATPPPGSSGQRRRRVYGWRLAFEHPSRDRGRSLGGCYLVGVTTDQFADFGERSGLQQSRLFWGVEDGGRRYEGGASSLGGGGSGGGSRRGSSGGIVQLTRDEAPRNSDNVLFGSGEVLTVVADLDNRTLHYWRGGTFLGSLVSGLPRAAEEGLSLYPVAVPFNAGVCVAICGLTSEPTSLLAEYHAAQKVLRERKNEARREALLRRRARLLTAGEDGDDGQQELSPELVAVLRTVFSWYAGGNAAATTDGGADDHSLTPLEAARLWYRCGLRLSQLRELLSADGEGAEEGGGAAGGDDALTLAGDGAAVTFEHFCSTVRKVVRDEESSCAAASSSSRGGRGASSSGDGRGGGSGGSFSRGIPEPMDTSPTLTMSSESSEVQSTPTLMFEVGDRVEVCEGYDRYGDAASGPLRPGDVGSVLEVQKGPRGDRQSIRVLYNGRRWWYQPQALLSERSGLVESSSVRFLAELLRSHGYDSDLSSMAGRRVTSTSWKVGDLVCVAPPEDGNKANSAKEETVTTSTSSSRSRRTKKGLDPHPRYPQLGRIVVESSSSSHPVSRRGEPFGKSATVSVDFSTEGPPKKVKVDTLLHTDFYHGASVVPPEAHGTQAGVSSSHAEDENENVTSMIIDDGASNSGDDENNVSGAKQLAVNTEVAKKLKSIATKLDKSSISSIMKECRTAPSLARIYAAGLPDSILSAIQVATASSEDGECDVAAVSSLGALVLAVCRGLFPEPSASADPSIGSPLGSAALSAFNSTRSDNSFDDGGSTASSTQGDSAVENVASSSIGRRAASNRSSSRDMTSTLHRVAAAELRGSNAHSVSVRELVRDLGVGPEQRRGVLLALMASARMHDDPHARSLGRIVASSSDLGADERGRHLLSSFGRLSAEAAAGFGFPTSSNPEGQPDGISHPSSAPTSSSSFMRSTGASGEGASGGGESSILRANAASTLSTSTSRSRSSMNTSIKSLIQNGILLNDPQWTKKILSNTLSSGGSSLEGVVSKARDEEDNSILHLAVCLGCSPDLVQILISEGGCTPSKKDLTEAARTDQANVLSLLLQQTVYTKGSIDMTDCSEPVVAVLAQAVERQRRQEDLMNQSSVEFASKLLSDYVLMTLKFRREGKRLDSYAKACVEVLVGEVLLHAIHQSQNQVLQDVSRSSNESAQQTSSSLLAMTGDDGRVPAFNQGGGGGSSSVGGGLDAQSTSKTHVHSHQLSLIDTLPAGAFEAAFSTSSEDDVDLTDSLTSYLSLMESYLWKKEMKDSVVGLTLACMLLKKAPSTTTLHCLMCRYGVRELATCHVDLANEALSRIKIGGRNNEREDQDSDGAFATVPIVKCPKGHTTILHLTRHSSFRCDLCGKGVEQGKPMHGCRECDWDACESCTDKAEGGLVKWRHIKRLALECQEQLSTMSTSSSSAAEGSKERTELEAIARRIRRRDPQAVADLGQLLSTPGKITLYEFVTFMLPALHAALVGGISKCGGSLGISPTSFMLAKTTRRRTKKPRVGGGASSSKKQSKSNRLSGSTRRNTPSTTVVAAAAVAARKKKCGDWIAFVQSLHMLLDNASGLGEVTPHSSSSSTKEDGKQSVDDGGVGVGDGEDVEDIVDEDHVEDGENEDDDEDEEDDDDGNSDPDSYAGAMKQGMGDSKFVPEILRRLHAILAFHERVVVTRYQNTAENGGELQSLLLPFEIELRRLPNSTVNRTQSCLPNHDSFSSRGNCDAPLAVKVAPSDSCTDLKGASIHVEPLMPLGELHLHILRCCRIKIPSYLRYCRRLAQDRAVIAERTADSSQILHGDSTSSNDETKWRIARVVAFDDRTGAHVVRYASRLLSSREADLSDAEDDLIEPDDQKTLADQLEFNGRESMLVLAARDYCILHRDRPEDSFLMDHDQSMEDVTMSDVRPHDGVDYVDQSADADQYMGATSADGNTAVTQQDNESISSLLLPVGSRVESDANSDDGWKVYTVLAASFEVAGMTNIFSEDSQSLTSQLETSVRSALANENDSSSDSMLGKLCRYTLVSDNGEVIQNIPGSKVRGHDALLNKKGSHNARGHSSSWGADSSESSSFVRGHSVFDRGIHIGSVRRATSRGAQSDRTESGGKGQAVGVLRRTWSALSPIQSMCPLELSAANEDNVAADDRVIRRKTRKMSIGGNVEVAVDMTAVEQPPILLVELSLDEENPAVAMFGGETTLFSGMRRLMSRDKKNVGSDKVPLDRKFQVFYSISMRWGKGKGDFRRKLQYAKSLSFTPPWIKRRWDEDDPGSIYDRDGLTLHTQESPDELVNLTQSMVDTDMDVSVSRGADGPGGNDAFSDVEDALSTKGADGIDLSRALTNCEGLNEVSVQCLQLLNFLGSSFGKFMPSEKTDQLDPRQTSSQTSDRIINQRGSEGSHTKPPKDASHGMFVSDLLTSKLLEQLEDPLSVVGGALPDWCSVAPAFAPRVFSHGSRRLLLERAAFGVSRAALRQQEAKVAVGPLRQRMAALRGRAVELVGEAFSGGAADPTALQLQADELYGMEEALAARVNAAFRAQRWDERSLQCAKAAVRREQLLTDAIAVFERYACDPSVNRRRLEVRFEGESGFDAASGDEAGVTRGFYADVAEVLLGCDHVAGIHGSPFCPSHASQVTDDHSMEGAGQPLSPQREKLPLWIPDIDASGRIVIPTPRADPMSSLGVFPRPLEANNPLRTAILEEFRFMGRLFAAAMRDGFVFPLPLSVSFLKLVQSRGCVDDRLAVDLVRSQKPEAQTGSRLLSRQSFSSSNSSAGSDHLSHNSSGQSSVASSPVMSLDDSSYGSASVGLENVSSAGDSSLSWSGVLTSEDLPRPGFIGGDVYAVERYICAALNKLEETEPDLTKEQLSSRMQEIATDKTFARKALGKSYDCSFEDYFEGRTFVDPLDPSQGEDAHPLCKDGARRDVTIENVREWATLAKQFILYDGVVAQAVAFRQGVNDFFSVDALLLLTPEELQRDVCGGGDNVDKWDEETVRSLFKLDGGKGAAEALVAVAAMGGEGGAALSRRFGPSSPTIGYLVKALLEGTSTQRRQFLNFVTSVPIVTPGQIEVVPVVSPSGEFLAMSDSCLPRANTCARRLYLPKFENYESFSQVFYSVVREESRFRGFFEWRG